MVQEVYNPETLHDSVQDPLRYSQARVANGMVYVSGQVATDANDNVVTNDFTEQARKAFENVGIILDDFGKDYSDITMLNSYMVNLDENLPKFREVWMEVFDEEPYPAHTTCGVEKLSTTHGQEGTDVDELLVEIEVVFPAD